MLKTARVGSGAARLLEEEGQLLARLDHPNLVAWHDQFSFLPTQDGDDASGFGMELVDGVPFNQDQGTLEQRLGRFLQLLSAAHYLHRCGYLHLDIKPDNVLVSGDRVVLIDLGSARQLDSGPGEAGGTLGYAAPEILQGHAPSVASDLYSLGAVFYELLTGHRPFNLAEPSMLREAILFGELAPVRALRPSVPRPLARLAESMLAVDPDKRPDSISAVAEMLLGLDAPAASWQPRSGTPLFGGRDAERSELKQALTTSGPVAVVGETGSGRHALVQAVARDAASRGELCVDLTRCEQPVAAIELLCASSWAGSAAGMVLMGRWEEHPAPRLAQLEAAQRRLPRRLRPVWCARSAPAGVREVRLGRVRPAVVRQICTFMGVYSPEDVRNVSRGTGGLPGRLMRRLGGGKGAASAASHGLHRLLSALPLGTPEAFVARLPVPLPHELPVLLEQGVVRAEQGRLFADPLPDAALSAKEAELMVALLGETARPEPLWTALVSTRVGDWDRARALLRAAEADADQRSAQLTELCEQLVSVYHRPAYLPLSRLYRSAGRREEAIALLAQIDEPSTEELGERVTLLRLLRRYPEAIAICTAQLAINLHPQFLNELISCHLRSGALDEAERLVARHEGYLDRIGGHDALRHRTKIAMKRLHKGESVPNLDALLVEVWAVRDEPDLPTPVLSSAATIYQRYRKNLERASVLLTKAISGVDRRGDRRNAAGLRINLAGMLSSMHGHGERAREVAEEGYRIAQELNARNLKMQLCYTLCGFELTAGRLPSAQRWGTRFFQEAEGVQAPPICHRRDYLHASLAHAQGEHELALAALERVPLDKQPIGFRSMLLLLRARVLCQLDRDTEVLDILPPDRHYELSLYQAQHSALRGQAYLKLARQELATARALVPDDLDMSYRVPAGEVLMATGGEDTDLDQIDARGADLERAARLLRGERAAAAASTREWLTGGGSIDLEGIAELTEALQDPERFPAALARLVTRSLGAHRVLIMLKMPGMGQQVSYNELTGAEAAGICDEVLRRIKSPSDYWLAEDAFSDPQLRETSHTVRTFELKSLVAVPIAYQDKAIGALYVDDLYRAGRFGLDDVKILRRLARAVGGLVPLISAQSARRLDDPADVHGLLTTDAKRVASIRQTLSMLQRERETNLLITGETGTGKSVLARRLSRELFGSAGLEVVVLRKGDPNMLVTQLMGSRRGDFTGAMNQEGAIQRALKHNRALFLDEVQNLGEEGQQILLPLLEVTDRRFGGLVGASTPLGQPLHIILATNVEISRGLWADHFREDLWYRMSAAHLHLPPIRERGVEAVYRYLADILREIGGVPSPEQLFRPAALLQVTGWGWPGNLRQLRTFAFQAAHRYKMTEQPIPKHELDQLGLSDNAPAPSDGLQVLAVKDQERVQVERMLDALRRNGWIQKEAAVALGMRPAHFSKLLKRFGLREQVKRRKRASRQLEGT